MKKLDPDLKDTPEAAEDFFLPDLCQPQSILFLVLISELLVVVGVLANGNLINFDWTQLGLTSCLCSGLSWLLPPYCAISDQC